MPTTTHSTTSEVKVPSREDYDWILEELWHNDQVYGTKIPLLMDDKDQCYRMLEEMGLKHVLYVIESTRSIIGGVLSPHILNPNITVLHHLLWWVPSGARGGTSAGRLLDAFIKFGKEHADWVGLSIQRGSGISERSLNRRGFTLRDHMYLLEV